MAGKSSGKRKAAAPSAGKRTTAAQKAAAKPKATSKSVPRPAAAPAKKAKPTPAAKAKPAVAKAPPKPSSGTLKLALAKETQLLVGCGFGIDQAVLLGTISVKLPAKFDLGAIEPLLEEFALAPPEGAAGGTGASPEAELVGRIHAWHGAIQRGLNVPVFGRCRLWDRGVGDDGERGIALAVPCHARPATVATLQFVIDALMALAGAKDRAAELPALRKRFASLQQTLGRFALLGINPLHFVEAAHGLGIEHTVWSDQIWAFGLGRNRLLLNSTVTSATPHIGVATAKDKLKCSAVLRAAGLPVADSGWAQNVDTAAKLAQRVGYPVVIKPANLDQGTGVSAGIEDESELRKAFAEAAKVSQRVMVEKHHYGRDYRVTVLHGNVIKVMDRRPGGVTGDGRSTVAELVEAVNAHDRAMRAQMRRARAPMLIDDEAVKLLAAHGYTADSVIPEGEFVALRRRANISAGGTYEILPPDAIHADNRMLAINATAALGLDIAGIDIISGDPARSWRETGGIIVEVNAQPQIGFRDTEGIFGEILMAAIGGKGEIPIHLVITEEGFARPGALPQLATSAKCNAASWGTEGWVAGAGALGPFANSFRAAKGVLLDTRVSAALVTMTEKDAIRFGLPAARFASIRLVGKPEWQPPAALKQLIAGHAPQVVRQNVGGPQAALAKRRAG